MILYQIRFCCFIYFLFFFFISSMILSILISFFCLIVVLFIRPYNDLNFIIFFRYLKIFLMKIDQSLQKFHMTRSMVVPNRLRLESLNQHRPFGCWKKSSLIQQFVTLREQTDKTTYHSAQRLVLGVNHEVAQITGLASGSM